MALRGSQPAVLRAIDESPKDSAGYASDEHISSLTQIAIEDIRDWLITLQDDGLVSLSRTTIGLRAVMEARGRIELREHQERLKYSRGGVTAVVEEGQPKIRPKGLRSFDKEDADFFLELLPGPYDHGGLPDGISFWKIRIEGKEPDRTFQTGVIYGPSGCGKSSLVKAGLLPRLPDHVLPVYVEATAGETESQLLKGLRKRCTDVPKDLGLAGSLSALRQDPSLASGKKVLLVIDQFEQWLVARRGETGEELMDALRHCDEERVQAILLVRDDYLSAAIQFMEELGVEFRPSRNARRVDLFGRPHAKKVLAAFGQSYGALGDDLTPEQQAFLNQAVDGLARDGVVIPVRLALFAEMLKGREWTTRILNEIGGAEGVGVAFLEENFGSSYADPRLRPHEKAVRSVLKALLAEGGEEIKGPPRSKGELLVASGYAPRPSRFDDLIDILDAELRLITPTAAEDTTEDQPSPPHGDRYYQLTHDYLVPSVREWLTRKRKETRRGRAELLLQERAALWNAKPENRFLPSAWESVRIRALTRKQDWTEPQAKMLRKAGWVHGSRGFAVLLIVAYPIWSLVILPLYHESQRSTYAAGLVQQLIEADISSVPQILISLREYRRLADPILQRQQQRMPEGSRSKLYVSLALLPDHPEQADHISHRMLNADGAEIRLLRDALYPYRLRVTPKLWLVLDSARPDDPRLLPAASALAL